MEHTVLICDDDEDIVAALEIYLKAEGYKILKAYNGQEVLSILKYFDVKLIILDIMMPILDGITTAVKIRETSNVPIIFLSAKSEDTDRVLGLNIGADDYVTKPFNPVELIARVRANIRRYSSLGGQPQDGANIFKVGDLMVNDNKKEVIVSGKEVNLTAIEYNILKFLISNKGTVFSSNQIYEQVWNEAAFDIGKIISVHIRHIREKIEISPKEPRYLKVVYGLGYKIVNE